MFRNLVVSVVLGPLVAALLATLTLLIAQVSAGQLDVQMLIAVTVYGTFAAYFFGWAIALSSGAANGVFELLNLPPAARLILAPLAGLLAAFAVLGPPALASAHGWYGLLVLAAAAALASLASAALAMRLRRRIP